MFSLISLHIALGYNEPVWGANGEIDPKGNNFGLSKIVFRCCTVFCMHKLQDKVKYILKPKIG